MDCNDDFNTLLRRLPEDCSSSLYRLVQSVNPRKTLEELADFINVTLAQVLRYHPVAPNTHTHTHVYAHAHAHAYAHAHEQQMNANKEEEEKLMCRIHNHKTHRVKCVSTMTHHYDSSL